MIGVLLLYLALICLVASATQCYGEHGYDGYDRLAKFLQVSSLRKSVNHVNEELNNEYSPVFIGPQDGLKATDKITALPGEPNGVNFYQYSGYVTVDPKAGRAVFYYFAKSQNSSTKPLVLWLNGGPGASSFEIGAMTELGLFRVSKAGKTLWENPYAWNNVENVLFLESPAGVGFSYSNTSSDYIIGDTKTAADSYTFLVNWLERFPEYKTTEFFIAGQGYADPPPDACQTYKSQAHSAKGHIDSNNIYAPLCSSSSSSTPPLINEYDPCSDNYVYTYLNTPAVQKSLHANTTGIPGPWKNYNGYIGHNWDDETDTVLPVIKELISSGVSVWLYSGDIDSVCSVTTTRYALNNLRLSAKTPWYAWYTQGEVGGYAVEYENLTFVAVRGAGHLVPSYQPARALTLFSLFLVEKLPPSN